MAAGSRFGWLIPTVIGLFLGAFAGACAPTIQPMKPLPEAAKNQTAADSGTQEESIVSEQAMSAKPTAKLIEENVTPALTALPTPIASGSPETSVAASNLSSPMPTPEPSPTEVPPAAEIGTVAPVGQDLSEGSLDSIITSAQPARAASLRIVEQARVELKAGKPDGAIRTMAKAISIDPTNPYAYFYLGQIYFVKKDYTQAVAFFARAENGFARDPAWLGETIAFEGASYEFAGRSSDAAIAYKRAFDFAPGNLMAGAGLSRLQASLPQPSPSGTPVMGAEPAGAISGPPEVVPPTGAPAENPPAAAPAPNH